jgi:hypothetical protein
MSLAFPAVVKVEPFNPVDAILDIDTAFALPFISYLSSILVHT